jgi:hypothetical protein
VLPEGKAAASSDYHRRQFCGGAARRDGDRHADEPGPDETRRAARLPPTGDGTKPSQPGEDDAAQWTKYNPDRPRPSRRRVSGWRGGTQPRNRPGCR